VRAGLRGRAWGRDPPNPHARSDVVLPGRGGASGGAHLAAELGQEVGAQTLQRRPPASDEDGDAARRVTELRCGIGPELEVLASGLARQFRKHDGGRQIVALLKHKRLGEPRQPRRRARRATSSERSPMATTAAIGFFPISRRTCPKTRPHWVRPPTQETPRILAVSLAA
jgi:hypothetical protein